MSRAEADDATNGLPFVARVETHAELGSTSDRAKHAADEPGDLPLLVIAEKQTAGRGRGANRWWAGAGALTFSVLLRPGAHGLSAADHGASSLATALALCDGLRDGASGGAIGSSALADASIKWPNDVLVGGRKIAGVLLEAPRPDRLVVGVGLNLNVRFDAAPAEIRGRATSALVETGRTTDPHAALHAFLAAFAARLRQLAERDAALADDWNARSALTGTRTTLVAGGRRVTGECVGIAPDGALRLKSDGVMTEHRTGTIAAQAAQNS